MISKIRDFCGQIYTQTYLEERKKHEDKIISESKKDIVPISKENEIEVSSQKEAIKMATIEGIKHFPNVEASLVWRAVYETHVHRKSGINDAEIISKVISADQSWKKSSGHAFEEMIKIYGTAALKNDHIEILLQRDLNALIKAKKLNNEPRDISWLKEQIKASVFDLYVVVHTPDQKQFCYGCIQSKTSIRDRVTRDREPSIQAMQSFFWSVVFVLDGDFLRLPKFVNMINGGSKEFNENGWHGMYVLSAKDTIDRIYPLTMDFAIFRQHALIAAEQWLKRRQWLDTQWRAE